MNDLVTSDAFLAWLEKNDPFSVEIFEGIKTPEVILGDQKWILGQYNNDLFICQRIDIASDPHLFPSSSLDSGSSPLRKKITNLVKNGTVFKAGEGELLIR